MYFLVPIFSWVALVVMCPFSATEPPVKRGQQPYVHPGPYMRMSNPIQAARLLLRHADSLGVDIDWVPSSGMDRKDWRIYAPSGAFNVNAEESRNFVSKASTLARDGRRSEPFIVFIQVGHHLSIREIASVLARGVRVYTQTPVMVWVARVPAGQVTALSSEAFVRSIVEVLPEHKYRRGELANGRSTHIVSLAGDQPSFRDDLRELGIEPTYFNDVLDTYKVRVDVGILDQVVELWWVYKVYQYGDRVPEGSAQIPEALVAPDSLRAEDSGG